MLWDRLLVSCRQQYVKFRFPAVSECGVTPGWHGRGGLEDASSRSKTTCVVQRDANERREATVILRSGNAPVAERSGCPTSKARSLAKQGRTRPRESPADRSWQNLRRAVLSRSKRGFPSSEGMTGNVMPFNPVPCSQGLNARETCICFWTSQAQ